MSHRNFARLVQSHRRNTPREILCFTMMFPVVSSFSFDGKWVVQYFFKTQPIYVTYWWFFTTIKYYIPIIFPLISHWWLNSTIIPSYPPLCPGNYSVYIWVNYNMSLNLNSSAMNGDDFHKRTMIPGFGRTVRSWWNLPIYIYIYIMILNILYYIKLYIIIL